MTDERGTPSYLRSDNGPEFVARSLAIWLKEAGVESRFNEPGSPWQSRFAEGFNSRLRAEFLNSEAFLNLANALMKSAVFQRFYNEERPHSSPEGDSGRGGARMGTGPGFALAWFQYAGIGSQGRTLILFYLPIWGLAGWLCRGQFRWPKRNPPRVRDCDGEV